MALNFTVSPSFPNERISDWYIFNTWLQRALSLPIHLELYSSFGAQRTAIEEGKVDLIYANPFDASLLVREKGFRAIARPEGPPDEMIILTRADSPALEIRDIQPGARLACSDDPCVNTVGRILLEPANLDDSTIVEQRKETYIQVARALLRDEAEIGFMPLEAFEGLSPLIRRDLRALVRSELHVIRHVFLAGPALAERADEFTALLLSMHESDKGRGILEALGARSWQPVLHEDIEFMIDIISTLTQ